jgi:hypothetical protein
MKKITLVLTKSGFTCYLKTLFSYNLYCKENNIKLEVVWKETNHCNGYFLDYFEKINDVEFVSEPSINSKIIYGRIGRGVSEYTLWEKNIFNDLKLLPYLKEKILENLKMMNNYISLHIRKTDFCNLSKELNKQMYDQEFIEFIEKKLIENKNYNIYLATDNLITQNTFKNKYPDKIKFFSNLNGNLNQVRQSSLEDAVIDIYMCVYAADFMGTKGSSFSDLINNLRTQNILL